MTPLVSAIIIVRDGESFIAEAVESVFAQESVSWELLVIDDGSRDRTIEIVRSFGDRVSVLHHPGHANLGMSASRNLGVAQARGDYIAFLDADDVWLPGKIADQVAILDAEPSTAMVYGRTLIWHSWDHAESAEDYTYDLGVPADATYPAGRLFRQLLMNRHQTPTTCNAMMRREAIRAVGGSDPALEGMFEDQLLFAKLLLRFPVHVSSRQWAKYRQHHGSASFAIIDQLAVDELQLRYLRALRTYIRETGGAPIAPRMALAWTCKRIAAQIAARKAKRLLTQKRR